MGDFMDRKVSIIIPMYNSEKFIVKTIDSVLAQDYGNIEIIVIDDGSKDNSYNLVKLAYGNKIKLIHKENSGVSDTRNVGLENATGDYIMFVDSDDLVLKNFVSTCVKELENVDQVIFNHETISEDGSHIEYSNFNEGILTLNDDNRMDFFINHFFNYQSGWCVWNRIFKKEIIEKYNIRFSTKYKIGEDQLFCLEYLLYAERIKIISEKYDIMRTTIVNLDKKSEMVKEKLSLTTPEIIYYYMMIYSEATKTNRREVIGLMKKELGFWRFKLIKASISFKFKAKLVTRLKIIKRTICV